MAFCGRFQIPVGFRFHPTVEELFLFLRMKVNGERLPHSAIGESDIYGDKEPWKIFDKTQKEHFFVFTKLKKKSKSRIDRIAGCGTWKIDHTKEVHDRKNKLIGFKKSFVFEYKKNKAKATAGCGHWIMNEFSLRDYSQAEDNFDEYVLCEIRNKDLEKKKYHHVHAHAHQVPVVEINQKNLNPGERNSVAAVPISSYSTTSTPILSVSASEQEMIDEMVAELMCDVLFFDH